MGVQAMKHAVMLQEWSVRIREYISENLLCNAVDDYISRTKIKARVTPPRMTNDMSFSCYPPLQNRSKALIYLSF